MAFIHPLRAFFSEQAVSPKGSFAIAASLLGAGLLSASMVVTAPANASVLVEPRIRRGTDTAQPSVTPPARAQASKNVVEIADTTAGFTTLSAALKAANLGSILSGDGPFTVFAPTDAAFEALPDGALEALLLPANRDLLVKVLYNHVGYGDFTSDRLASGSFETFDGSVNVAIVPTGVTVDGARVVQADVDANNGVVHAVDKVLLPNGFVSQLEARINSAATPSTSSPTPLQQGAINRPAAPVAPAAPATTATPAAPRPAAPATTATPAAPRPAAPAAPAAQQPVRGLW
jgi:uncharacterized surface protein with fasciclin (FAS1) repeats